MDGWMAKLVGWMAKMVLKMDGSVDSAARLLVTVSSLGSNPDIYKNLLKGLHKQSSGQHTLALKE